MLGAIYAALAALTFAMNNAAMRRGVLTGTSTQAMAITVPLGAVGFLIMVIVSGEIGSLSSFPRAAVLWLICQGILHFIIGRFFNFQANKLVGVNVSAPVVQLQVVVTMLLAVLLMKEPFTVLQAFGTILMLAGSFSTQLHSTSKKSASVASATQAGAATATVEEVPPIVAKPVFKPRYLPGFACGLGAALAYGISPLMVRISFAQTATKSAMSGALIAYVAATIVLVVLLLTFVPIRRNVLALNRNSAMWFVGSGVLVAMSQGFVYASLSVAPLMVVSPILQLSLFFRLILSEMLNREHEVLNAAVVVGAVVAVAGSVIVSLDTNYVLSTLGLQHGIADVLRFRLAGGPA